MASPGSISDNPPRLHCQNSILGILPHTEFTLSLHIYLVFYFQLQRLDKTNFLNDPFSLSEKQTQLYFQNFVLFFNGRKCKKKKNEIGIISSSLQPFGTIFILESTKVHTHTQITLICLLKVPQLSVCTKAGCRIPVVRSLVEGWIVD